MLFPEGVRQFGDERIKMTPAIKIEQILLWLFVILAGIVIRAGQA